MLLVKPVGLAVCLKVFRNIPHYFKLLVSGLILMVLVQLNSTAKLMQYVSVPMCFLDMQF